MKRTFQEDDGNRLGTPAGPDRTAYKKVALRQAGQRPYGIAGDHQPEAS